MERTIRCSSPSLYRQIRSLKLIISIRYLPPRHFYCSSISSNIYCYCCDSSRIVLVLLLVVLVVVVPIAVISDIYVVYLSCRTQGKGLFTIDMDI